MTVLRSLHWFRIVATWAIVCAAIWLLFESNEAVLVLAGGCVGVVIATTLQSSARAGIREGRPELLSAERSKAKFILAFAVLCVIMLLPAAIIDAWLGPVEAACVAVITFFSAGVTCRLADLWFGKLPKLPLAAPGGSQAPPMQASGRERER